MQEVDSTHEFTMSGGLTMPNRRDKSALGGTVVEESGRHGDRQRRRRAGAIAALPRTQPGQSARVLRRGQPRAASGARPSPMLPVIRVSPGAGSMKSVTDRRYPACVLGLQ